MSATLNVTIPPSIQTTDNTISVVGFDINLNTNGGESDFIWPYSVEESGSTPAGTMSVAIYADTLTVTGDLVNIGQNIEIFVRQLNISPTTIINTSAADPAIAENYLIGDPAIDTNTTPGATGANGANGGIGANAGDITIIANVINLQAPAPSSNTNARLLCLSQALESIFTTFWSASTQIFNQFGQISIPDLSYSWSDGTITFGIFIPPYIIHIPLNLTATLDNNTLSGAQTCCNIVRSFNLSAETISLDLSFGPISINSQNATLELDGILVAESEIDISFVLNTTLVFNVNATGTQISFASATQDINDINVVLSFEFKNQPQKFSLSASQYPNIQANLLSNIGPTLQTLLNDFGTAYAVAFNLLIPEATGLYLMADGGVSGRGQDGGTGISSTSGISGNGGNGGASGNGGNGGAIALHVGTAPVDCISANAAAGFGEITSLPGNPGQNSGNPCYANGLPGAAGAPGSNGVAGVIALNGAAFNYGGGYPPLDYNNFVAGFPLSQLFVEQQAAKLYFIAAEVPNNNQATQTNYEQTVIPYYMWLYYLTLPFTGQNPIPSSLVPSDISARAQINAATSTALGRLNAGLSYYGTPINWTPAINASTWSTIITDFLSWANTIYTAYQTATTDSNSSQISQVNQSINTINSNIETMQNQLATVTTQIQNLAVTVNSLSVQVASQESVVSSAMTQDYQTYTVGLFGSGCTFSDIVQGLEGVYAVASGIAEAETSIVAAAKSIASGVGNIYDSTEDAISNLQTAANDWASLQAAWQALLAALQNNASSGAIAIDAQQFDSLMDSYFSNAIPAFVPALQTDIQVLVTLAQSRNQARASLTVAVAQAAQLQAEITQKQQYIEYIQGVAASANQPPILPEYVQFLANEYNNIANQIIDMMWEMNQALQYYTITSSTLNIPAIDIATLSDVQSTLEQNLVTAITQAGTSGSTFKNLGYTIPTTSGTTAITQINSTKQLTITLSPQDADQPFGENGFVVVDSLTVTLNGLTSKNSQQVVNVNITQSGPDIRYNCDSPGTYMSFCHGPLTTEYQYVPANGVVQINAEFGSAMVYNGVSPFAIWCFDFTSALNAWINWTEVSSITISFTGSLRPPLHEATAAQKSPH
jgi:phage shock protein A